MFVLAEMQDTVRIQPHRFSHDMKQELSDELNKKFANKVQTKKIDNSGVMDYINLGGASSGSVHNSS